MTMKKQEKTVVKKQQAAVKKQQAAVKKQQTAEKTKQGAADRETVLVALVGTSPAVLTETVWALAHEKPSIVPDRVTVLTTRVGKEKLNKDIRSPAADGGPSVWERLKAALAAEKLPGLRAPAVLPPLGDLSVRVCPDKEMNELDDLRDADDNMQMANFLLKELRSYTENPGVRVIASIAGGRKTMSALMLSCMSLLGRDCDRVCHVLVNDPFDKRLEPLFFFPEPGATHKGADGTAFPSSDARIELFDVPFVRMRGWYQDRFKSLPPSYRTLVTKVRNIAPEATVWPEIELDVWNKGVTVNGEALYVSDMAFALLILLAQGVSSAKEQIDRLIKLKQTRGDNLEECDWIQSMREKKTSRFSTPDDEKAMNQDLSKISSDLRSALGERLQENVEMALVPKRSHAVRFPPEKVVWKNWETVAEVCKYLFPNPPAEKAAQPARRKGKKER